jgi:acyl-CoA synthetase (NDP forming)
VGSSARHYPQTTVRPIIDSAAKGKPLAAFLVPEAPEALAALSQAGVPNFRTPEACADAIAAALARRRPLSIALGRLGRTSCETQQFGAAVSDVGSREELDPTYEEKRDGGSGRVLDELESGALLDRLGVPRAPATVLEADIAHTPELPFPFPVAVKILSAAITHKTDIGGVMLGVADASALLAEVHGMRDRLAQQQPPIRLDRVLVQPMVSGLGEVLVGYRVDRDVGPLIMLAAGGVLAEIIHDRSLRLAPVDLATAREMIAEVRGLVALDGYRGKPKGDLDALARAIVALSQLADEPTTAEAEINPLIVRAAGEGVMAVDAVVRLV